MIKLNLRFDKSESRSEGLTTGGYSVDLPDGRTQVSFFSYIFLLPFLIIIFCLNPVATQVVTYTVAGPAGYQAKVEYFPTASYRAHSH